MASTIDADTRLDDLEWLMPALWPDATPAVHLGRVPGTRWFVSNPSPADCRLLVPGSPRRAASQAVRRYHDGASTRARLEMVATESLLRLGLGGLLGRRIISIDNPTQPGLIDHLADALDQLIGSFAVTLGPRRANRKPVLQLFDVSGHTTGFAKVAVDAYTDALVRREVEWLGRAADSPDLALRVPTPLWNGDYAGHRVSVIAPCWATRRPPGSTDIDHALVRSIHLLTEPELAPAGSSAPARALAASSDPTALEALRLFGNRSEHLTLLGAWHGDLTPWNLLTTAEGRTVIDWETAESGHPLGADALHHHVASAMQLDGRDPAAALRHGLEVWNTISGHLGLGPEDPAVTAGVLLLEYVRRDLDLRAANRPVSGLGDAALAALAND